MSRFSPPTGDNALPDRLTSIKPGASAPPNPPAALAAVLPPARAAAGRMPWVQRRSTTGPDLRGAGQAAPTKLPADGTDPPEPPNPPNPPDPPDPPDPPEPSEPVETSTPGDEPGAAASELRRITPAASSPDRAGEEARIPPGAAASELRRTTPAASSPDRKGEEAGIPTGVASARTAAVATATKGTSGGVGAWVGAGTDVPGGVGDPPRVPGISTGVVVKLDGPADPVLEPVTADSGPVDLEAAIGRWAECGAGPDDSEAAAFSPARGAEAAGT